MPTPFLKKLSEEKDIPISRLEEYWDKAVEITEKKFDMNKNDFESDQWAYVTGIVKNMANDGDKSLNENSALTKVRIYSQDVYDLVKDKYFRENFPELAKAYDYYADDPDFRELNQDNITTYYAYYLYDMLVGLVSYRIPKYSYLPQRLNGNYLDGLDVAMDFRSQGIGSQIMQDITSSGIWCLNTDDDNYDFYRKNGFELLTPNEEQSWAVKGTSITPEIREALTKESFNEISKDSSISGVRVLDIGNYESFNRLI